MNLGRETELIEFKKTTGELKEGIISLASMLNKNGKGTLYFGVRNNGKVLGQQIGNRTLREIAGEIANAMKPQIIPTIMIELYDDKNVIKITAEGNEKPYSAYGKYYVRSADEDREVTLQQLPNLTLKASDSIVNIEADNQELGFEQLKLLYAGKNLTFRKNTFEQKLNLLTHDGAYNLMASLLADTNSYSIKVAVFRGRDRTDLVGRKEYGYKCMLVAVKQVLDYMEALNGTAADMGDGLKGEGRLFDFPCFKAAWLNACLHTCWSRQTPPTVCLFEDRIEIISVGGLPDGLTPEEFYEGKSKPVNPGLWQIMVQLGDIEQTGHGVPLIVSRYGREVFDITENYITVTIPLNKGTGKKFALEKEKSRMLDSKDEGILMLMEENSSINVAEISRQIHLGTTMVTKRIRRMKEKGIIERTGAKKKGQWIVNR